jgi:copper/silver efflux system protein
MIQRTIAWSVANRLLVFTGTVAITVCGFWAMQHAPLDALPDGSDTQVIISTEWPGRSPDLIETQVTSPLVASLVATPRVRSVRGVTDFGVSFVYVIFDDGTDTYWARSRVLDQLRTARVDLPEGIEPTMAPAASAVGRVFEYALVDVSGRHSLDELRTLQDWTLRSALASVRGVAEVASIGGSVKQYQVNLDPARLSALNISPKQIVEAIRASNDDVEGRALEFSGREYIVRARGSLTSIEDIRQVALGATGAGTPLRVGDVAEVRIGPDSRRGIAELDGKGEVVGGIVIMRVGQNALTVIEAVKQRLSDVQRTLPEAVSVVPVYDRSELISSSISTLQRILVEEAIVVSLVVIVFLLHLRAALIPLITLPVAVLATFIPLWALDVNVNIMSLGGIALAIGVLIDAAIIMVENGHRTISERTAKADPTATILRATRDIGRAVFFSLAVIVVSFVPVLLLEGQEGRLFRPLALTKTFAVAAVTLLAITLVPALMVALLRPSEQQRRRNPITELLASGYEPVLRFALRRRLTVLALTAAIVPLTALLIPRIGTEFMPALYEGAVLYMPTAPAGVSITEVTRVLQVQDQILSAFPEVVHAFGTAGRATTATDNSPLSMVNTTVTLKPRREWRAGLTFEALQAEMDAALQMPGFPSTWTQPIRNRVDMLSTGIKTPVGLKILGSDLRVIQELSERVESILRTLPGTRGAYAERVLDGHFLDVRINREAIARHGLVIRDVQDMIQTAIGGKTIARTTEGRERYPINVRYQYDFRSNTSALEQLVIKTPAGGQVFLGQVASVVVTTGPAMIRNENGLLAGYVYVDTETADIGAYVSRAKKALNTQLKLPAGYLIDWSGQYELQLRAASRLRVIVPIVLLTIFFLLQLMFRSSSEALTVMLSVVYAMTGGVVLQWLLGYQFSVAVCVGYIALFGVAVQTGVIMVVYLHEAVTRRLHSGRRFTEDDIYEATVEGAVLRLRPKLMTVTATIAALLPIMWSTGVGADLLKPIAAPIIGGMITSALHVLIITPVIFYLMQRHAFRRGHLAFRAIPESHDAGDLARH